MGRHEPGDGTTRGQGRGPAVEREDVDDRSRGRADGSGLRRLPADPLPHPQRHRRGVRQRPPRARCGAWLVRVGARGPVVRAAQRDGRGVPQPLLRRRALPDHDRLRAVAARTPSRVVPHDAELVDGRHRRRARDPRRLPARSSAHGRRLRRHARRLRARHLPGGSHPVRGQPVRGDAVAALRMGGDRRGRRRRRRAHPLALGCARPPGDHAPRDRRDGQPLLARCRRRRPVGAGVRRRPPACA
jgi:hypothetical protein